MWIVLSNASTRSFANISCIGNVAYAFENKVLFFAGALMPLQTGTLLCMDAQCASD
jgi:hypothetical protein